MAVQNLPFRVLIADDMQVSLMGVSNALKKNYQNLECDTAATGDEALQKVSNTVYDLVIMDYHLGNELGSNVAREILKHRKTWIVGYTDCSENGPIKTDCLDAGMLTVLPKRVKAVTDYAKDLYDVYEGLTKLSNLKITDDK